MDGWAGTERSDILARPGARAVGHPGRGVMDRGGVGTSPSRVNARDGALGTRARTHCRDARGRRSATSVLERSARRPGAQPIAVRWSCGVGLSKVARSARGISIGRRVSCGGPPIDGRRRTGPKRARSGTDPLGGSERALTDRVLDVDVNYFEPGYGPSVLVSA